MSGKVVHIAPVGKGDETARLRPTSDRVRESLFNILVSCGVEFEGIRVLDLFAGTGALGFEALSRGAARVVFVETGVSGRALIRKNIEILQAAGGTKLLKRDATGLGSVKGEPFGLCFCDPPYGRGAGISALSSALAGGWLAESAVVVLEEGEETSFPSGIRSTDRRKYGDTFLHFGEVAVPGD